MLASLKLGAAVAVVALLGACDDGGYGRGGGYGSGYGSSYGRGCPDGARCDRDDNPPGARGGAGTNWENPPGPRGGPGASPHRRDSYYRR